MANVIYPFGNATVNVAAAGSLAIYTEAGADVYLLQSNVNHPASRALVATIGSGAEGVIGPLTDASTLVVEAKAGLVYYETGVSPKTQVDAYQGQGTPTAVNATAPVTAAAIQSMIVTSTTAAAVAGTVPTGAVMDASSEFAVGDFIDWSVINTGAANAFTVTGGTGHTVVGVAAVVALTSARFRTVKTAAATFVTYRLS